MPNLPSRFPEPAQCVLWNTPELVSAPLNERFDLLETYTDESHFKRHLLRCRECGQLYFHEFYEWIDWENGNDPQYSSFIPVSTPEDALVLSSIDVFRICDYAPALRKDFPKDAEAPRVYWLGK